MQLHSFSEKKEQKTKTKTKEIRLNGPRRVVADCDRCGQPGSRYVGRTNLCRLLVWILALKRVSSHECPKVRSAHMLVFAVSLCTQWRRHPLCAAHSGADTVVRVQSPTASSSDPTRRSALSALPSSLMAESLSSWRGSDPPPRAVATLPAIRLSVCRGPSVPCAKPIHEPVLAPMESVTIVPLPTTVCPVRKVLAVCGSSRLPCVHSAQLCSIAPPRCTGGVEWTRSVRPPCTIPRASTISFTRSFDSLIMRRSTTETNTHNQTLSHAHSSHQRQTIEQSQSSREGRAL